MVTTTQDASTRLFGVRDLPAGVIRLAGGPTALLCFSADERPPELRNSGALQVFPDTGNREPRSRPCDILRGLVRHALGRSFRPREVVVHRFEDTRLAPILVLVAAGCGRFYFTYGAGGRFLADARSAALLSLVRATRRNLAHVPGLARCVRAAFGLEIEAPRTSSSATRRTTRLAVERAARHSRHAATDAAGNQRRVCHVIGTLGIGGAERQLAALVRHSIRLGWDVSVVSLLPPPTQASPIPSEIRAAGARVVYLPEHPSARSLPRAWRLSTSPLDERACMAIDHHAARSHLAPLVGDLLRDRPDVLHCWLDHSNCVGGVAGLLVGVERLVLSVRNVNPDHFPQFWLPWFRPSYRLLSRSKRVTLVSNSRAGAEDYAHWAGIDAKRFHVIPNGLGVECLSPATPAEAHTVRVALGFAADAPLVAGVFRLAPEKRPFDFVELIARIRNRDPRVRAIHLGDGPLANEVRERVRELGLEPVLRSLGAVADPTVYLRAADVSVLTSAVEGFPNVSIESQAVGVPVVLTRAGGAAETVVDGETGFVVEVGDLGALEERIFALLNDPTRRAEIGRRGRASVLDRFSPERMVAETLALYTSGWAGAPE